MSDAVEVISKANGEEVHYVGEAAEEMLRLFNTMFGTDEPTELERFGIRIIKGDK